MNVLKCEAEMCIYNNNNVCILEELPLINETGRCECLEYIIIDGAILHDP
jgi:hypothetical protein